MKPPYTHPQMLIWVNQVRLLHGSSPTTGEAQVRARWKPDVYLTWIQSQRRLGRLVEPGMRPGVCRVCGRGGEEA